MFRCFFPDEYVDSTYMIDFDKLYQEGYRGLIFDIDNTLVPHGAPADTRAIALFRRLKELGFGCCLLSNNQKKRVASFNDAVQVNYIENAHKPSVRNYNRAMEILGTNTENTIFIGDQLFTDVYGAKRAGIRNILVKPIDPKEEIQIVLKRYLEKIVLYFYEKRGGDFMNHVVIIGFMGSGKTRVGKQLSKDLGLSFVDLERLITRKMNMSAREIFQRFGEPYYRALETVALKQLIQDNERRVISLGAGLPLQEQNEKYLKELGTVVYLKGSLATLKKRLEGSSKDPMLDGDDRDEKIKKLLKQRDPVYQKFADVTVVTGEKPFEELIKEIEEKLAAQ